MNRFGSVIAITTSVVIMSCFSTLYAQTITSINSITVSAIVGPEPTAETTPPIYNNGGGGGGGIGLQNVVEATDSIRFRGLAYPGSIITLLKNGVVLIEVPASPNGTFSIGIRSLPTGIYNFSLKAEDDQRRNSVLDTYTVYITSGVTTLVDGLFMSPTITTDKITVKKGDPIILLGKSYPNTDITLIIHSEVELQKNTKTNASGAWLYKLDTTPLELGGHESKAKALTSDDISEYSTPIEFTVGDKNVMRNAVSSRNLVNAKCDLNNDSRVNLLDFSIMAFWYKRVDFPVKVDLNVDKKLNLTDFSILAYCWTG